MLKNAGVDGRLDHTELMSQMGQGHKQNKNRKADEMKLSDKVVEWKEHGGVRQARGYQRKSGQKAEELPPTGPATHWAGNGEQKLSGRKRQQWFL